MPKQLYRSQKNKMIGGVAGGIAKYFDIDPVIVRALFVITALGWGISVFAYIILWIIVPQMPVVYDAKVEEDKNDTDQPSENISDEPSAGDQSKNGAKSNTRILGAIILISIGFFMLLDNFVWWVSFKLFWPMALIAFGAYIIYRSFNKKFINEEAAK